MISGFLGLPWDPSESLGKTQLIGFCHCLLASCFALAFAFSPPSGAAEKAFALALSGHCLCPWPSRPSENIADGRKTIQNQWRNDIVSFVFQGENLNKKFVWY